MRGDMIQYVYCIGNLAVAAQLSWRRGRGGLDVYCDGNLAGAAQLSWRRGCGAHDMCTVMETWQWLLSFAGKEDVGGMTCVYCIVNLTGAAQLQATVNSICSSQRRSVLSFYSQWPNEGC